MAGAVSYMRGFSDAARAVGVNPSLLLKIASGPYAGAEPPDCVKNFGTNGIPVLTGDVYSPVIPYNLSVTYSYDGLPTKKVSPLSLRYDEPENYGHVTPSNFMLRGTSTNENQYENRKKWFFAHNEALNRTFSGMRDRLRKKDRGILSTILLPPGENYDENGHYRHKTTADESSDLVKNYHKSMFDLTNTVPNAVNSSIYSSYQGK